METSRPNLVPAFIAIVILAGFAILFRGTIASWFESGDKNAQTVVMRQTPAVSPTPAPTIATSPSAVPTTISIAEIPHSSVPKNGKLPTAGPEEDIIAAFLISGGSMAYIRSRLTQKYWKNHKNRLDIL